MWIYDWNFEWYCLVLSAFVLFVDLPVQRYVMILHFFQSVKFYACTMACVKTSPSLTVALAECLIWIWLLELEQ